MLSQPVLNEAQKARMAAVGILKSGQCRCGGSKQTGMAFCYRCWLKLPQNVRHALYRKIGNGFEAAYDVACQFLKLEVKGGANGKGRS